MAATELRDKATSVEETGALNLGEKVAEQVSEILHNAERHQPERPVLAYRIPSPGVRYYF